MAFSSINIQPITDHIIYGQRAYFNVTITNDRKIEQSYEIFSPTSGIGWSVLTRPLRNRMVTIGANQTMVVLIEAEPIEKFAPGVYIVNLDIQTNYGESYQQPLKLYMGPVISQDYFPSLRTTIDVQDKIDPRQTQAIRIFIENLNPLDLKGMNIKVISEIPELNMEQAVDVPPNGQKTVDFAFKLPDQQQPKMYTLFFQFERGNEIIKVVNKQVEVIPLILPFTEDINQKDIFLRTDKIVTFTNPGNVRNIQTVKVRVGGLERIFTSSNPEARVVYDGEKRSLAWDVEIGPGEHAIMYVTTSYRTPLLALLLLLVVFIVYEMYKNPVGVSKTASNIIVEEGGVSALKITLVVRNMSSSLVKDVEILDEIPSIAAVEKDVEVGTLKPLQILHNRKGGIFVKWKLSMLEGKEERLISYKIKSRLNIIGTLRLPPARVTYILKNGRKAISYSNPAYVGTIE